MSSLRISWPTSISIMMEEPLLVQGESRIKWHISIVSRSSQIFRHASEPLIFQEAILGASIVQKLIGDIWMHRQPEHVMTFLLAEMGTSGSLDGQQRLVVKGRFAPKKIEGILWRYINEYVICNGCKSPDTILLKENRLFFLRCEKCGFGRSVAPIKAGFVARVGRRKAGT